MWNDAFFMESTRFLPPDLCSWEINSDIHIWRFPVAPANFYFLTEEEKATVLRFRFEEDRIRFSVGRQSLRLLIAKYLSVKPETIVLSAEKNHKPALLQPEAGLHFNVSHSGGWVLIAVTENEVGVDIELVDEDFSYQDILVEHFSHAERTFIADSVDPLPAFYYLWTRKEALTKAWGTGLQENLQSINALHTGNFSDPEKKSWQLKSFCLSPVYPAAVACSPRIGNILYYQGEGYLF